MSPPSANDASRRLATLALAVLLLFVALVGALHVVRPDLEPETRHLSEYAVGEHGWMMKLAFVSAAIAIAAVALALLRSLASSPGLTLGGRLLLLAAVLNGALAIFPTDLSIAPPGESLVRTTPGHVHDALAALHAVVWLVAPILITRAIGRDPIWKARARVSLAATAAEVLLAVTLIALQPFVPGLGQRMWVASLVAWCVVHALLLRRITPRA